MEKFVKKMLDSCIINAFLIISLSKAYQVKLDSHKDNHYVYIYMYI